MDLFNNLERSGRLLIESRKLLLYILQGYSLNTLRTYDEDMVSVTRYGEG